MARIVVVMLVGVLVEQAAEVSFESPFVVAAVPISHHPLQVLAKFGKVHPD